ncbi:ABC transporter permease [Leucobacter rhizosphaerae]|uniref:ABC transporter permease n=1 Tax=Leucobacter rhizosphaerae TaxID=2932245 RepID=A0ABY4FSR1_9MICO|nr:ABC transporter permease [Leucobacter rhizosphaerae]UOQ59219.1 ABC transporter permease [Leucobacter rhizosphaerae]
MAVETQRSVLPGSRVHVSQGLVTMVIALVAILVLGLLVAPSSLAPGVLLGVIPFASVLAIVGLGQMLVVQQSGIDLSVPGAVSIAVVLSTHVPNGDSGRLGLAVLLCVVFAVVGGLINGFLVGVMGLNAVITTLGSNGLMFGAILAISGGVPRTTTSLLASITNGNVLGIPNTLLMLVVVLLLVSLLLKKTVAGRRFEGVGASPAATRAMGLRVRTHKVSAYVWAQLLYSFAGIMLAGIVAQPTAYLGNNYLLPSVAVVVLGGTSLLGGRGFPVATIVAAFFLTQLEQFSLALGVPYAARTLMQAGALVLGVAIYTINWGRVRRWLLSRRSAAAEPASA